MEYFENECTEILEGLYVSGEKVAKDYEALKKHGITHIVNCAADYCENWFEDRGINYLAFFLKDSQNESIECLFYRVIEFIESALKSKRKILVHCIQGISRSVTMAIAYVMFVYKYDYKKAEAFVKQKRGVASPNNGFMVELIQFHKRLYEDFDSLPQPRIYLVSSHCKETPQIITARLLKHPLYEKRKNIGMDCRGIYIIVTRDEVLLWVGSRCE
jgi:protein-tyrosine phosphatase